MLPKQQKKAEIKLKFILNDDLIEALKNYEDSIIQQCKTEEEKEYYEERKSNIHSGIINTDEQRELENYLAYKAGFTGIVGNYYSNWKRNY